MTQRQELADLLWELKDVAQDASNDLNPRNLRRVQDAIKKVRQAIPGYQWERTAELRKVAAERD